MFFIFSPPKINYLFFFIILIFIFIIYFYFLYYFLLLFFLLLFFIIFYYYFLFFIFLLINLLFSNIKIKIFVFIFTCFPVLLFSISGLNGENFLYVFCYMLKYFLKQKLYFYDKNYKKY